MQSDEFIFHTTCLTVFAKVFVHIELTASNEPENLVNCVRGYAGI